MILSYYVYKDYFFNNISWSTIPNAFRKSPITLPTNRPSFIAFNQVTNIKISADSVDALPETTLCVVKKFLIDQKGRIILC